MPEGEMEEQRGEIQDFEPFGGTLPASSLPASRPEELAGDSARLHHGKMVLKQAMAPQLNMRDIGDVAQVAKNIERAAVAGEYGPPWNKKAPAGMDMFAEIAWKKRQKDAKAAWMSGIEAQSQDVSAVAETATPPRPMPSEPPLGTASQGVNEVVNNANGAQPAVDGAVNIMPGEGEAGREIGAQVETPSDPVTAEDSVGREDLLVGSATTRTEASLQPSNLQSDASKPTSLSAGAEQQPPAESVLRPGSAGSAHVQATVDTQNLDESAPADPLQPIADLALPAPVDVTFASSARKPTLSGELQKLEQLRKAGALTERQFEIAKEKLIGRSTQSVVGGDSAKTVGSDRRVGWAADVVDVNRNHGKLRKSRGRRRRNAEAVVVETDPGVAAVHAERARLEAEAAKAKAARMARRAREQSVYAIVQSAGAEFGLPTDDGASFLNWKLEEDEDVFSSHTKGSDLDSILPKGGRDKRIAQLDHELRNPLLPTLQFDRQSAGRVYMQPQSATVSDIANWLASLELSDYIIPFQEHEIDGPALLGLSQRQLFDEVGVNDMEDLSLLWAEIELLQESVAEAEAAHYQEQEAAAFTARKTAFPADQTQRSDSTLPMKQISSGNPLNSLPASDTGLSEALKGIKTVKALHNAARKLLSRGFAPGSRCANHRTLCT